MTEIDGIDLLFVEDDPDDARFVERLLTEYGSVDDRLIAFDAITRADRLEAALDRIETDDPDLVLLDLGLPDSDGLATIEAVVDHAPHLPVVVLTGRTESGLGPEAIQRGAQDYLKKGRITDEVLHRTLRYAVDRHDKQREIVELNHRLSLLNRIVRQDVRNDVHMVVGRGDELRERVGGDAAALVESLLDAARDALERTERASELDTVLSTDREPDREPVDLAAVLDEQAGRARERADADVALEGVDDEVTVLATPMLGAAIEQVLTNAIRHNDADRPEVNVTVDANDDRTTVAVADDGVGIPDVQKELLNDPDARYHERSGMGTGLYLAMTVVEQSGGTIEFADNRPRGTVVTLGFQRPT